METGIHRVHLLLIEDERRFAALLARRLEEAGHSCTTAFTGPEGLAAAVEGGWDIAIIDVMLPDMDGIAVTEALRARGIRSPILMLTARDAIPDRVAGLKAGADDYLVKPFAFDELLARLEALSRRSGLGHRLTFGPIAVDLPARLVMVSGRPVELTGREFDLLECLLRAQGRVVTRAELKRHVWGFGFDAPTKVADLYVHYLRTKLAHAGASDVIETVRGTGYAIGRLASPLAAPPAAG